MTATMNVLDTPVDFKMFKEFLFYVLVFVLHNF